MDGKAVIEGLLSTLSFLLILDFLEDYEVELGTLNDGKVGRLFKLIDGA
jgi:hypothetical protein